MLFGPIRRFFAPPPHIARLPQDQIKRVYSYYRIDILTATYFGYAMFYIVRNNLSPVTADLKSVLHYNDQMIGNLGLVTALSYGVGKFLMGSLSDRSDPRKFMACGLLMSALLNLAFGAVANYWVHLALWGMNGVVQGMGWPPCGREIGHWFCVRERGSVFSIWNTATNVGGMLAGMISAEAASRLGCWQAAFYVPAGIAILGSGYLFWRLRDTPQSVGLPPIEEYKDDYTESEMIHGTQETELSNRELFVNNILKNKYLWVFALANLFVYFVRYGMLDWGPMYLREVKGATQIGGGHALAVIELGGIPSTLLLGWYSDKLGGRRGMVSLLSLIPIPFAFMGILLTPPGFLWIDMTLLGVIGFFIYPPIMLLALAALDLTSKKAVGTAAGFVGMFGYLGGRSTVNLVFGNVMNYYGPILGRPAAWEIVIRLILAATLAAIAILTLTWRVKPRA